MTSKPWAWAPALLLALAAGTAGAQQAARHSYIVQLDELPVSSYAGKIKGYAATKPTAGRKIDMRAAHVQAYIGYLNSRQSAVLSTLGNVPVTHRYRVAFPGFAAKLTDAEVAKLAATPGVRAVMPDVRLQIDTSRTPAFLGLSTPGGLWSQGYTGENVIIGVIDTGISPENPAFSDKVDANGTPVSAQSAGTVAYAPITNFRSWNGVCSTGPGFQASDCNNKLIGARFYNDGLLNGVGFHLTDTEFNSPRDGDGHGSHTSSTAGGNKGVPAVVNNAVIGAISGMAPRARIAMYKVCWHYVEDTAAGLPGTCISTDSVQAIDDAVADGVDVINFSISGTQTNYLNAVEVAFLFAADAGVFVAASAGNSGPGNTVAHPSPWLTTVAASTHDRSAVATATLGNGATYTGASFQSTGVPSSPLILASDAAIAGATATQLTQARLCFAAGVDVASAVLDPAKIAGKIVVCDRGTNNRVSKSLAVAQGGGVGVLLLNTSTAADNLVADIHSLPTVHLPVAKRSEIRTYAATPGATASISAGFNAPGVIAPQMADFSSRGPSLASPSILKPDVAAPGVDVLAAATFVPGTAAEQAAIVGGSYPAAQYEFLSGTSMASPHVAGIAADLRQAHPDWSPAAIKSALMTTTTQVLLSSGAVDPNRFGYGAGQVNPNGASATGLVYDAGTGDYFAFLCGQGLISAGSSLCQDVGLLAPWNLNLASLTSEVVGVQSIWRVVTNVGKSSSSYTPAVSIPGFNATVTPASLNLSAGQQGVFRVDLRRTTAPIGEWVFGNLDWSNGAETVRSPLTLKAMSMVTPAEIDDGRVRASRVFTIGTGYDGTMRNTALGLVPANRFTGSVEKAASNCTATFTVPAGASWVRVALFNRDSTGQGNDDLDLRVFRGDTLVGSSGGPDADELVHLNNPGAGTYTACVDGFAPVGGISTYTLSVWVGTPSNVITGSLRAVSPAKVVTAGTGTVALTWSVPAGNRYYGTVNFFDGANTAIGRTALFVDGVGPLAPNVAPNSGVSLRKAEAKARATAAR